MSNVPVDIKEQIKKALTSVRERAVPLPGNTIKIEAGLFQLPTGESADEITVVLLDWRYSRSYFDKPYQPGSKERPKCFALSASFIDSPHGRSPEAQATQCSDCPFDEWGSALNGGGKACREHRLLAVTTVNADLAEPMLLRVPPTSLSAFDQIPVALQTAGKTPFEHKLRISLEPQGTYSKMKFKLLDATPEDLLPKYLELYQAAQKMLDRLPVED